MEGLTETEAIVTMSSLWEAGCQSWLAAAEAYDLSMPELGAWWAKRCATIQSAYTKLLNWPSEPEQEKA